MQWGPAVKEKNWNEKKGPFWDPRGEWAACCNSELPVSEMQRRGGPKDAAGSTPALGEQSFMGQWFFFFLFVCFFMLLH